MEQNIDFNKEVESGRAGKNKYDSEVEQGDNEGVVHPLTKK